MIWAEPLFNPYEQWHANLPQCKAFKFSPILITLTLENVYTHKFLNAADFILCAIKVTYIIVDSMALSGVCGSVKKRWPSFRKPWVRCRCHYFRNVSRSWGFMLRTIDTRLVFCRLSTNHLCYTVDICCHVLTFSVDVWLVCVMVVISSWILGTTLK